MKRNKGITEYQRRINLLSLLKWKPGEALSEYAQAVTTFWFGKKNGKNPPGANPLRVPTKVIATFVVHYAPHTKLKIEKATVRNLAEEYNV